MSKNPSIVWENVWININQNFLDSKCKIALYYFVNDIIPTKFKLFKHKIRGTKDQTCNICGQTDDKEHRLRNCEETQNLWNYVKELIIRRLRINVADPLDILECSLGRKNEKLALFILAIAVEYNMRNSAKNVKEFQKILSDFFKVNKKDLICSFGNFIDLL